MRDLDLYIYLQIYNINLCIGLFVTLIYPLTHVEIANLFAGHIVNKEINLILIPC